ncbi:hypothetical protein OG21DRAFT_1513110 [Imleria badia]|nr:hypothetical protein OG21DRAFT_1513110 [Imleria badia]
MRGPIPTTQRAKQRGCVVWAEIEQRAYMFGAVRNERNGFVEAFLRELRARPDLFQVVLRSETDQGRNVRIGSLEQRGTPRDVYVSVRGPAVDVSSAFTCIHEWQVEGSVVRGRRVVWREEVLLQGYLTILARDFKGWFFRFKTFPVTYFVILDTVPYRDRSVLARNVSWAALRAGGYAEGEYTLSKYAAAADKLVEQCAQERLAWLPEEIRGGIPKMQDQMGSTCIIM